MSNLEGIAIIGMSGRFPGAGKVDQFWQNIRDGVESITFFTDEELRDAGVSPALIANPDYVKAGAVIEGIEEFDALFFGYSPREAETIDPQHRLFLEVAWEAFENAGYQVDEFPGLVSVFAGAGLNRYLLHNLMHNQELIESIGQHQMMIGNDKDFLSTRVSYKLNLKGASVNVQTACSTSLVAVHLACQSLLNGECDLALAGGASIEVKQKAGYLYQEGGVASSDGHTRAFDASSNGTVFGSGVGAVVLKRLEEAVEDGDQIYAVIKGSAINNDGATKVSYTAPSVNGQEGVISEALAIANIDPGTIRYLEAHGTGTAFGDPIEIEALTRAFREYTDKTGFCGIGSVKTNIGHLDIAAGVTGLIKATMAIYHQQLPPSLHFAQPNPVIDFANSPFYVNSAGKAWAAGAEPRRAGVSSFGFGGTNAHAVLEEAPALAEADPSRDWKLLIWSAKTDTALAKATDQLLTHLTQHAEQDLGDVAYTLQVGRKPFEYRRMLVCRDREDAIQALQAGDPLRLLSGVCEQEITETPVAFMFSGTGNQYVGMGRDLYETEPEFHDQVNRCAEILEPFLGLDIRDVIYPTDDQEEQYDIYQMSLALPALFVVEYAYSQLLIKWGVKPQAMIGHSLGEYVAACLAGVFSLADALSLVTKRGRMFQEMNAGAMLTVNLSPDELKPLLGTDLSLATVNAPTQCALAGSLDAIDAFEQLAKEQGISYSRLHVPAAAHSHLVEPMMEGFANYLQSFELNAPTIPFISNVTGTWIAQEQATDPNYWVQHLRQTVRFADGIGELCQNSNLLLLEVGPGKSLSSFAMQSKPQGDLGRVIMTSMRHINDVQADDQVLMNTLGKLWLSGVRIDWDACYEGEKRRRVPLPTYPFERQRYWIEAQQAIYTGPAQRMERSVSDDPSEWFYAPLWQQSSLKLSEQNVAESRRWLVFVDECGLANRLVERLTDLGHQVLTVEAGAQFGRKSDSSYLLNMRRSHEYDELVRDLQQRGLEPDAILHGWSVSEEVGSQADEAMFFEAAQFRGFYSLIFLARALGRLLRTEPLSIWALGNALQQIESSDVALPAKSTLLGACKVVTQEYSNLICRSLDVALPKSGSQQEQQLLDRLLAELLAATPEREISYRGHVRWGRSYQPIEVPPLPDRPARLRDGGVYLITGGLGATVGQLLGTYLAKRANAKLVLTTRAGMPARAEWEAWLLQHGEADRTSQRIRYIQELEQLGAEVLVVQANVTDAEQMKLAFETAEHQFGRLDGVIHAAGVYESSAFTLISETGYPECEHHFATKVHGAMALQRALEGRELDFCLLVSSLSSLLGGTGFAAHAAAHQFLDAFAERLNAASQFPWITVNWDIDVLKEHPEIFGYALHVTDRLPAFIVSKQDVKRLIDQIVSVDLTAETGGQTGERTLNAHARPSLHTPYVEPGNETERLIVQQFEELLGIEPVGVHDAFFDLGGNSLLSTKLVTRLRALFQIDLPLRIIFDAGTTAELALYIEDLLIAAIENLSEDELRALEV